MIEAIKKVTGNKTFLEDGKESYALTIAAYILTRDYLHPSVSSFIKRETKNQIKKHEKLIATDVIYREMYMLVLQELDNKNFRCMTQYMWQ